MGEGRLGGWHGELVIPKGGLQGRNNERHVSEGCHMTHLIVQATPVGLLAPRTLKYMRATMQGCWVVDVGWMAECIARGRLVPEAPYEAAVNSTDTAAASTYTAASIFGAIANANASAAAAAAADPHGAGRVRRPQLTQAQQQVEQQQARQQAQRQGQRQGQQGPEAVSVDELPGVMVLFGSDTADAARVKEEWGHWPVGITWLYDCVSNWRLLSIRDYTLEPKPQPPSGAPSTRS
ncbi:hypothetical protein TSOC_007814 [Tetrabaena socialis]|uniref:BRCT domain-containing protein n=1 Tax=Tetrabaena socialis TaxID=47790 RepID=A0A2J8A056_9CHLO|nr:hypothetical protein TSOC_007814 [Tetrabaena socialis]|eukprot:PNH05899.1 hypothetical protein TSOC_007814 [Tetrabaena socialis]